ncbi:MAG: hypothetical protein ABSE08_17695 [Syntrophobacteraceae bacterium]
MIKPRCPRILLVITFLALTLTLSSVYLYAGPIDTPGASQTFSKSNVEQIDVKSLNQSGHPGLMAQAQAEEHHCVGHCRHHYEERLKECNEPGHEHHHRCEEWAREREKECLEHCYREEHR